MDRWTLVLEAVPGSLRAVRVDEDAHRTIDVDLADGDITVLNDSLAAVLHAAGSRPAYVVLVVPGDIDGQRFADLGAAVRFAGLPEPSWLPDAVACAGTRLAGWSSGLPVTVIDARGDDLVVWPVRTADDGVEVGEGGARDLGARLDALLTGVVHAKLAVVAPGIAEALRRRTDPVGRRDAAHLSNELREARRLLSATDGDELVVTAGDAEVYVTREEFTDLVDHARHDTTATAAGPATHTIVVAHERTPIAEHLAAAAGASLLVARPESAPDGAAALVLPRPHAVEDPTPTDGIPLPGRLRATAIVPLPRETVARGRPPIWAVPALAGLLVLSLAGAATVLATSPDPAAGTGATSPVVPVGFDRLGDPGR
ncbi:hypothetical protein [Actinomycetospora aeridis]|uniref:Uncharacterized protein n=1 Tax=Actinomycetospora aeridis TaxID=3129231 RepID=A0ABU8NA09_9PSEU